MKPDLWPNVDTDIAALRYKGSLREYEPLASHTSWRVGGKARYFYVPASLEDWSQLLQQLPDTVSVDIWGLGSNLLVRDGGIGHWVMALHKGLGKLTLMPDGRIWAEAGVPTAKLAKFAAEQGFCQAGFWAGIPGTVGGALRMNAGAFGGETWHYVSSVQVIDRDGHISERSAQAYDWGYRRVQKRVETACGNACSSCPEEWFSGAFFAFSEQIEPAAARLQLREGLKRRNAKQPIGQASGGSVFKNPPGQYAARFIEEAGLKGFCMGGAMISPVHANFIVNARTATAADIENLMEYVQRVVYEKNGIMLEPEVHIVGTKGGGSKGIGSTIDG